MTGKELTTRDEGELGPAMAALTSRQRAFVLALFDQNAGHGALAAAARQAEYTGTPETLAKTANRLVNDDAVIAAIQEVTRKRIRSLGPAAIEALQNLIKSPGHKDHARGLAMALDRIDPQVTKQEIDVTHTIVDHTKEALETLRYMKSIGATREMLEAHFGFTGLSRYEALLARENVKVIDAQYTEVPAIDDFMKPWPDGGGNEH